MVAWRGASVCCESRKHHIKAQLTRPAFPDDANGTTTPTAGIHAATSNDGATTTTGGIHATAVHDATAAAATTTAINGPTNGLPIKQPFRTIILIPLAPEQPRGKRYRYWRFIIRDEPQQPTTTIEFLTCTCRLAISAF